MRRTPPLTDRRSFLRALGGASLLSACRLPGTPTVRPRNVRLAARPTDVAHTLAPGTTRVRRGGTDIVTYLPRGAVGAPRIPVFVFLHGALRTVEYFVDGLRPLADEAGAAILAPYAVAGTWDALRAEFGPDVTGIDVALGWLFSVIPADPARIVLAGFSDGGSYTLSLGRANGDLFSRLVAFSPGLVLDVEEVGKPSISISHGTDDQVLPFEQTRDFIVPALRGRGYQVDFQAFKGDHSVSYQHARAEFLRLKS